MPYKSEQAFSDALLVPLKKHCPFVQRIESALTGRGIPDIYCRYKDHEAWIELKNDPRHSIYDFTFIVEWRKGQQAWHLDYLKASGRPVITLVAMRDGFLYIPLMARATRNLVTQEFALRCTELKDLVRLLGVAGGLQRRS